MLTFSAKPGLVARLSHADTIHHVFEADLFGICSPRVRKRSIISTSIKSLVRLNSPVLLLRSKRRILGIEFRQGVKDSGHKNFKYEGLADTYSAKKTILLAFCSRHLCLWTVSRVDGMITARLVYYIGENLLQVLIDFFNFTAPVKLIRNGLILATNFHLCSKPTGQ